MRVVSLVLWAFALAAACESKDLVSLPPDPSGNGGEAGESSGLAGAAAGAMPGAGGSSAEGGAGGAGLSVSSFHFEGTVDAMVEPTGAGGDGAGGATGEGGASGTADLPVTRVECTFYGDLIEVEPNDAGGFSGLLAGEVFRRLWSGDSPLFEFQAVIGGPGDFTIDAAGNVELHIAGDQPDDAKPFWLEIETLSGTEESLGNYSGAWTCASLMIDEPGFRDVGPDVSGTWQLEATE